MTQDSEVFTIGNESIVIGDTDKEGTRVLDPSSDPSIHTSDHPIQQDGHHHIIPDRTNVRKEFARQSQPVRAIDTIEYRMCKLQACHQMVTPSKNPGVKKLFCSERCSTRYHSNLYRIRSRSKTGQYLERTEKRNIRFHRMKPNTAKQADLRYRGHLDVGNCPNAGELDGGICPSKAREDWFSKKKLCLIYATLVDDMKELWALDDDRNYAREWTTHDGRWLDLSEFAPHIDVERGLGPKELMSKPGNP